MTVSLIAAVRTHALANYSDGWDEVVEAWSDQEIVDAMGKALTANTAIRKVHVLVKARNAYAAEIRATAW